MVDVRVPGESTEPLGTIYLGIATLSFGFIVEEVFARWESVTGGNSGKHLVPPQMFGYSFESTESFYFLCLGVAVVSTLAILNLLRSPTGRAFVAIRDSEISAQSMGIHLARYKTLSFSLSAALAGVGGALYAHKLQFISPDQFNILQSIDLLLMIVIGGLGSVHGAFLGAIFLIGLPQALEGCDLVITGEGAFDHQSLRGKVVAGVAGAARDLGLPCVVLAGRVSAGRREAAAAGVTEAHSLVEHFGDEQAALTRPAEGLRELAARLARQWSRS